MSQPTPGRPWFGRKRIGWGMRPISWQGWLLTVVYMIAIYAAVRLLAAHHGALFVGALVVITALYIAVAWAKRDE
jgi:hypothetical protein